MLPPMPRHVAQLAHVAQLTQLALLALLITAPMGCLSRPYTPSTAFFALAPLRHHRTASLRYAARHFRTIYGHAPERLGGLQPIRPRLGLPAFVQRGTTLEIDYLTEATHLTKRHLEGALRYRLVRHGKVCPGPDCFQLTRIQVVARRKLTPRVLHVRVRARTPRFMPSGFYDLIHAFAYSAQLRRLPSAVQVLVRPPERVTPLTMVHLTDLHQGGEPNERLRIVIDQVNRLRPRPTLVVITGDLVEQGPKPSHWDQVIAALSRLQLPCFVVIGNHDYYRPGGLGATAVPKGTFKEELGLRNFLRAFHPFLAYRFRLGGYHFLALDTGSGATLRSLWQHRWITTQGLDAQTLEDVRRFLASPARLGHVILSHAPPRARLRPSLPGCKPGRHGSFLVGRRRFEELLLASWGLKNRPLVHLHGHLHWNDLYQRSDGSDPACRFQAVSVKQPALGGLPCWRALPVDRSPLIVGTQSATKHNPLRSGGWHQRGLRFGQGAGAGYGFRVLHVKSTQWLSAGYRFYHRTAVVARGHRDGFIAPGADRLLTLPRCPR